MTTGHVTGPRLRKFGDPQVLDRYDTRWLLPWKLVSRALSAGDLLFFHAATEQRQAVMARVLARRTGLR
jgi:hypothetical protein